MEELSKMPEWKQAVDDAVKEFKYGDTISHEWLYEHFKIEPPGYGTAAAFKEFQFKFLAYVEAFKDDLLVSHFMYLRSARGVGYIIVEPEEQPSVAWSVLRHRIYKELNRASSSLTNIRLDFLSNDVRCGLAIKQATLAHLKTMNMRKLNEKNASGINGNDMQIGGKTDVPDAGNSGDDLGKADEEENP